MGLDPERLYRDFNEMAQKEAARPDGIDFVIIATPNHAHYPAAKAFLQSGIHVACDKPLTLRVEEAEELAQLAEEKGLLFCVTYAYSQYPVVKHAQQMVKNGDIGDIHVVVAEYPQGWLATAVEQEGNKQAAWRTDPEKTGISNCVGDIGSHIENTVSYITGLEIDELCARLDVFGGEGRSLDTNAHILVKYKMVPWATTGAPRWPSAMTTPSPCASSAPRVRSSGARRIRTTLRLSNWASRSRSSPGATPTSTPRQPRCPESLRGIRKASMKPLPTPTGNSPMPCSSWNRDSN